MTPHNNTDQIRKAITEIWPKLPDEFRGHQVWSLVNRKLPHLDVYQDSILHCMRSLNRDIKSQVKYDCINRQDSLYKKVIKKHSK